MFWIPGLLPVYPWKAGCEQLHDRGIQSPTPASSLPPGLSQDRSTVPWHLYEALRPASAILSSKFLKQLVKRCCRFQDTGKARGPMKDSALLQPMKVLSPVPVLQIYAWSWGHWWSCTVEPCGVSLPGSSLYPQVVGTSRMETAEASF